jgi:hypothetical protein
MSFSALAWIGYHSNQFYNQMRELKCNQAIRKCYNLQSMGFTVEHDLRLDLAYADFYL